MAVKKIRILSNYFLIFLLVIFVSITVLNCSSSRKIRVSKKYAEITFDNAPLRSGTSADFQAIGMLSKGTQIKVLAQSEQWVKVKVRSGNLKGKIGYMAKPFITFRNR